MGSALNTRKNNGNKDALGKALKRAHTFNYFKTSNVFFFSTKIKKSLQYLSRKTLQKDRKDRKEKREKREEKHTLIQSSQVLVTVFATTKI